MRGVGTLLAVVVGLTPAGGCGSERQYGPADNPTTVTDSTGVAFGWLCDGRGCHVTLLAPTPAPDPCSNPAATARYSFSGGRFLSICSVCTSSTPGVHWTTTPGQCRILACETDDDCPTVYNWSPATIYECVRGLCQDADTAKHRRDVVTRLDAEHLCFAVRPRSETYVFSPANIEIQQSIEASCPGVGFADACPLPPGCRTP